MRFSPFAFAVSLLAPSACSSSSSAPASYKDKCQAECSFNLHCADGSQFTGDTVGCAETCTTLTNGLSTTCAQCVIENTLAAEEAGASGQLACETYQIGSSSAPVCQVACGTGDGKGASTADSGFDPGDGG